MPLETTTFIDGLEPTNPVGTDSRLQGDDHIRLLKSVLKASFPNMNAAMSASGKTVLTGTPAAARTALGSTTVGDAVFVATNAAAARTALGVSASGDTVFTGTAAAARTALGASTIGANVFVASTNTAAEDAMGVTRSLAASGYRKTGDGLIEQWGTTTGTTGAASSIVVTFPIAFPTSAYTVVAINGDTAATLASVSVNALISTQFSATFVIGASGVGSGVAVRVNWIAKGK